MTHVETVSATPEVNVQRFLGVTQRDLRAAADALEARGKLAQPGQCVTYGLTSDLFLLYKPTASRSSE